MVATLIFYSFPLIHTPKLSQTYLRSGWLQFLPNLIVATAAVFAASSAQRFGYTWIYKICACQGAFLTAVLAFDVATIKLGLHPTERPPLPRSVDVFEVMLQRRSCRSFQAHSLSASHLKEILHVSQLHTQPCHLMGDRRIRLLYVQAPLTVWPVVGAREFLVALVPKHLASALGRCCHHFWCLQPHRLGGTFG